MTNASPRSELLFRWQEGREQGQDVSAEQLCVDCPEMLDGLKDQIAALRSMESFLGVRLRMAGDGADGDRSADTGLRGARHESTLDSARTARHDTRVDVACRSVAGYEILGELGRGGMGVVYRARQPGLKRLVALKMILAGSHARPEQLARFRTEAEAVARLQHPNIVHIYEIGEHDGLPYFSLEYVAGGSLASRLNGTPLPPRHAAELVETLARAVHAAHQRGIVHRDLKPANVLLQPWDDAATEDAEQRPNGDTDLSGFIPKITDFGLAKQLDAESTLTESGAIMGTPSYMAPEQAAGRLGDIGPLSDVYALGTILYELVTGRPPFKGASVLDTLELVRSADPVPPSRLQPKLPRDLEIICLKSLHKEPARRYPSAAGLADDLGRYFKGEPIQARPVSSTERLVRWCSRNPRVAALSATVLFLLVVVAAGSTAGMLVINEKRRQASGLAQSNRKLAEDKTALAEQERGAREEADAKRKDEQQARELAMDALRSLTDDVVQEQMARRSQITDEDRAFLRKILQHYEVFAGMQGDSAESRSIRAEGYFRVGLVRHRLGELVEAETAYLDALAIQTQLSADFPVRPEFRQQIARSQTNLGNLLSDTGRLPKAETAYVAARAILQQLVVDFPMRSEFRQELATSYNNLGLLLSALGRPAAVETAYRDALAIREQLAADFPTRSEFRLELAQSQNNLGNLLSDTGRMPDAETAYRAALTIQKQLIADFPTRTDLLQNLARSLVNLGILLRSSGRLPDAETAYGDALAIQKQLVADFPTRPELRQELARSHNSLGLLLSATGRLPEAEMAYRAALAIQKQLASDFPTSPEFGHELAQSHNNLGILLFNTGRLPEAEAAWRDALAIQKQLVADFPERPEFGQNLALSHNNLGILLSETGRQPEAEMSYRDALSIQKQLAFDLPERAEFRQDLARAHHNLGDLLRAAGRMPEAETAYCEALVIQKQLVADFRERPEFRQALARTQNNIGDLLRAARRLPEAESASREALAIQKQLAADFPTVTDYRNELAGALANLSLILRDRREFVDARRLLEEAEPHHQATLKVNPRNPDYRQFYVINLLALVPTCAALGDLGAAAQASEKLRDLGWDPPNDAYNAACALALGIPAVNQNDQLTVDSRQQLASQLADRAMEMLHDAVTKGYKDAAHMKEDTDLDPLRERPDFQKLIADLEDK